ncbi:MAG: ImmA/IrrE family metallo-endopeptidase [Lachnospiraceae bacterium]|jgi:Zn-dependent peptidase ImmA (M78 family)
MKTLEIADTADQAVRSAGSRDALRLVEDAGVRILFPSFCRQKGAYAVINDTPFIFVKQDLSDEERSMVILHELGHHYLHSDAARMAGGFRDSMLFDRANARMETEANLFAAQILIPDDEFSESLSEGQSLTEIAAAMNCDPNLVALKADIFISKGFPLNPQEHRNDFFRAV